MARSYIGEMKTGQPVNDVYMLVSCELKTSRNGSYYLAVKLGDRTGIIEGRMWDASQTLYEALDIDDFVQVKGTVETYREKLQLSIKSVTKADTEGLRLGDFLPQSERPPKEMQAELVAMLSGIEDADYAALRDAFLNDEEFMAAFRTAPAAVSYHHSYLGGLIEHTLGLMSSARAILEFYPVLRHDVLMMGILFHDIGKTRELRFNRTFAYTDPGQLVGHLVIGVMMLEEKARELEDFPPEKLMLLQHCILSHHGLLEYGSPKLPMTAEAFAIHYLDNLDAKLKDFSEIVAADLQTKSDWTNWVPQLQRRLYKK